VQDYPLVFADPTSASLSDLIAADRVKGGYVGEVYFLVPAEGHRWFWLSHQRADELLLFTSFDSHVASDSLSGEIHPFPERFCFGHALGT